MLSCNVGLQASLLFQLLDWSNLFQLILVLYSVELLKYCPSIKAQRVPRGQGCIGWKSVTLLFALKLSQSHFGWYLKRTIMGSLLYHSTSIYCIWITSTNCYYFESLLLRFNRLQENSQQWALKTSTNKKALLEDLRIKGGYVTEAITNPQGIQKGFNETLILENFLCL